MCYALFSCCWHWFVDSFTIISVILFFLHPLYTGGSDGSSHNHSNYSLGHNPTKEDLAHSPHHILGDVVGVILLWLHLSVVCFDCVVNVEMHYLFNILAAFPTPYVCFEWCWRMVYRTVAFHISLIVGCLFSADKLNQQQAGTSTGGTMWKYYRLIIFCCIDWNATSHVWKACQFFAVSSPVENRS